MVTTSRSAVAAATDRPLRGSEHAGTRKEPVSIRRILCPVDFSEFSRAAVAQATVLARASGAEITALFVFPFVPPPVLDAAGVPTPAEPDMGVLSAVAADLSEFLRPIRKAGLRVRLRLKTGDPARQILDHARLAQADLVVMGTHGRSGFERLVLGSVTDRVLRKAACPVLTVSRPAKGSEEPRPVARILCAIDLSESSTTTLAYALSLARSTGAALTLVHVLEGIVLGSSRELLEAEARQRLREAVTADGPPPCPVAETVVAGKPYREILRLAAEREADLIVIGSHGRDAEDCAFFGATADHVVRQAPVPVLTVRARRGS